jgi:serine protease inhibitor
MDELLKQVTADNWSLWQNQFELAKGIVYLPKFKFSFDDILNNELVSLGMGIAFDGGADFTRMYQPGGIWIDQVIHKTFVEVNEAGTEAAAVTAVMMGRGRSEQAEFMMRIDHPFIFIIYEQNSHTILFMGTILNPMSESL